MDSDLIPLLYDKYWSASWRFRWSDVRIVDSHSYTDREAKIVRERGTPVLQSLVEILDRHQIFNIISIDGNNAELVYERKNNKKALKIPDSQLNHLQFNARGTTRVELPSGIFCDVPHAGYLQFPFYDGHFTFQMRSPVWAPINPKGLVYPMGAATRNAERLQACLTEVEAIAGVECINKYVLSEDFHIKRENGWPFRSGFRVYVPRDVIEETLPDQDLEQAKPFIWETRPRGVNQTLDNWRTDGNLMYLAE